MRTLLAVALAATLVAGSCTAFQGGTVSAEQRAWCLDHQLPDPAGGASVVASAHALGIASAEVERALGAFEATAAQGARLLEDAAKALAAGDAAAIERTRAAYAAWQTDVALPAQKALADAIGAWSTTPEWAESCADAFGRRGASPAGTRTPAPATIAPTSRPTAKPTASPAPTPRLTTRSTITYTSKTSVGRLIELTIRVTNPGKLSAGKVSVQVEGVGYAFAARTPIVGCIPNCHAATGAEGIGYVEWTAPAPGKSQNYTVQLKAARAGTYRIEVRAGRGPAASPIVDLASWTVTVRVT